MYIILAPSGYVGSKFFEYLQRNGDEALGVSRNDLELFRSRHPQEIFLKSRKSSLFSLMLPASPVNRMWMPVSLAKADCLLGNAVLPGIIREVCEDLRISWGHISSGCIYSGRRSDGKGWTEEDEPNFSFRDGPCSFYSGSKALGEEVLAGAENCFVWRLRIPFNEERSPRNYIQKLVNYDSLLEAENSVSHLDEFVEKCVDCFEKDIEPGVYNMTNQGSVTTRQVTEWMIEEGVTDKGFKFFENEEQFMQKAAKTPRSNCVLDTSKAEKAGIGMRPVEEAMRDSMRKMAKEVMV